MGRPPASARAGTEPRSRRTRAASGLTGTHARSAGARLRSRLPRCSSRSPLALGPLALAGSAAGALTMNARIMLQGHARAGCWAAIQVDLQNDGPPIVGELQMDGGNAGATPGTRWP